MEYICVPTEALLCNYICDAKFALCLTIPRRIEEEKLSS
jgi:hypothetical protein